MVTVNVFFEGGADPRGNPNSQTVENTVQLRESFNKLLNSAFNEEQVRIQATPAYSISNAVKMRQDNAILLIDLDGPKGEKEKRISDNGMFEIRDYVFFMVQEMEAWILSQPNIIEDVFRRFKHREDSIADHRLLKDRDPESIRNPVRVLETIFMQYFTETKGGKKKKLKYGKLKTAPLLIESLNFAVLADTFEDVRLLVDRVNVIFDSSTK